MTLSRLLQESRVAVTPRRDVTIRALTSDSRKVQEGALFAVYPGGERYLESARKGGATAVLVESSSVRDRAESLGFEAILLPDFSRDVARIAHTFFGYPTRSMRVLGVTGTNGKTTVAWLVRDMVRALGRKAAYLGTLGFGLGDELYPLANTTPFAVDLVERLAQARDAGCELLAMEVSSHALAEGRVEGVEFDVAVFTNLTQDHLDFHGSMEAYASAKKKLFENLPRGAISVLNLDDATGRAWAQTLKGPVVGYRKGGPRLAGGEGVRAEVSHVGLDRIELALEDGTWATTVDVPLGGAYNVENALAAFSGVLALHFERWLGADFEASESAFLDCADALEKVHPVPGRFETVPNDKGIVVIVDYAHTPDALEKLLLAVRPLSEGKVVTIFGCGGDRDRTKRPLMGRAAAKLSDRLVVTSDNPRTEDPVRIAEEIVEGIEGSIPYEVVLDRAEAIRLALSQAERGDVVVIAGKGHEDYQIVGKEKQHLDDRELALEALT